MKRKQEIITFKVDDATAEMLKHIPNRSEFIRGAVLHALDSVCMVCQGTGILTPKQKEHWQQFAASHPLEECGDCHELHLVCTGEARARSGGRRKS